MAKYIHVISVGMRGQKHMIAHACIKKSSAVTADTVTTPLAKDYVRD